MHQHHPKRQQRNLLAGWSVEELESRRLLSGGVFDVSKIPVYVPSSADISDAEHGPLGNAGSALVGLYSDYRHFVNKGGKPSSFSDDTLTSLESKGTSVGVTVRVRGTMTQAATLLHNLGAELIDRDSVYSVIDAWVPIAQLSTLAQAGMVANLNPVFKPQTSFQGIAPNQADEAENADTLRSTFGLDGSGVKVGVLSDSVNSFEGGLADSVATGDLPKGVTVLADFPGGEDEGRAMLELIHDIAPGAQLFFATAEPTPEMMARNITALVNAGCQVIVDDITYPNEPVFQSGVIDQAIINATENHGVTYLSSARNASSGGYQNSSPHWVKDISGRTLLDFDPSSGINTRMRLTVNGDAEINLQWDNPYNGVVGAATQDLSIQFIDPATGITVVQSTDANLATSSPIDQVLVGPGTYDVQISINDSSPHATLPTVVQFSSQQIGGTIPPITDLQFPSAQVSTGGHNAGIDTISVGAVPFYAAPPANGGAPIESEPFSSLGPVINVFTANGERRKTPVTLQKPDLSGIDGVNTSFFGDTRAKNQTKNNLPEFFGTSAAAPNVAAVVALLDELDPAATPAEIKAALIASAEENPVNGQKPGTWDPQAGFGLIDALEAAHQLDPSFVVAEIGRIIPTTVAQGPDSITIHFSDPVVGFSLDDLSITRGKGSTDNLLNSIDAKLTTNNHQTFTLSGLGPLLSKRGTYYVNLNPVGVVDSKTRSHPTLQTATIFFVSGEPTGLTAIAVSGQEIDLSWTDNTSTETGFTITRALDAGLTVGVQTFTTKANVSHFKDLGLSAGTQYFYQIRANVNDGAPNPSTDIVNTFTLASAENIVDNRSLGATIKGAWTLHTDTTNAIGGDYLSTSPANTKSVTYTPDLDADGSYYIYVRSIAAKGNATNTQVQLLSDGDVRKTFTVNQRTNNGWVLLGQFNLNKGTGTSVRIVNTGANGTVVADAVRFQRNG
jgi:hypothetical protein